MQFAIAIYNISIIDANDHMLLYSLHIAYIIIIKIISTSTKFAKLFKYVSGICPKSNLSFKAIIEDIVIVNISKAIKQSTLIFF